MVITRRGGAPFISKRAVSWLAEVKMTPAELLAGLRASEAESPAKPLWLGTPTRRIRVRRADENRKGSIGLILEELPAPRESLSTREAEVLYWLTYGKSSEEIAGLMRIQRCTVRKHLERLFEKLGVENRTAAASFGHLLSASEAALWPNGTEGNSASYKKSSP